MSQVPTTARISIMFTSWWQAGTDKSTSREINKGAYRDSALCPALPMTQLKGVLRETAERFALLDQAEILLFFGKRANDPQPSTSSGGDASIRFSGDARLAPEELDFFRTNPEARAQMFASIGAASTSSEETQEIASKSRRSEVVVPVTLQADVQWVGGPPPPGWVDKLDMLCAMTPAFGSMKNDGYGRAVASCAAVEGDPLPRPIAQAPHEAAAEELTVGRQVVLRLRPREPFVFSRSAGNQGFHQSLAGPTGAALLGWAAQNLYSSFAAQGIAGDVFHSGAVRFSDGVRIAEGEPVFVSPAILVAPKHAGGTAELGPAAFAVAFNSLPGEPEIQSEAIKSVPVTLTGVAVPPGRRDYRQRSAVNTPSDNALFGYEYVLPSGIEFRATVDCDPGVMTDEQWLELIDIFDDHTLFLGRGRWTGYGGSFDCSVGGGDPWPALRDPPQSNRIRVWLLTDAAILDRHGNPKSSFDASDFGLDGDWQLDLAETAAKTLRVWPWNGHLGARDFEIGVVAAGSVFTFNWTGTGRPTKALPAVVGCFRERGLGRVTLIPDEFRFTRVHDRPLEAVETSAGQSPPTPLADWAYEAAKAADTSELDRWISQRSIILDRHVRSAALQGPSASQWNQVAMAARGDTSLDRALRSSDWDIPILGEEVPTLRDWVGTELFERNPFVDQPQFGTAVARVVRSARQTLRSLRP